MKKKTVDKIAYKWVRFFDDFILVLHKCLSRSLVNIYAYILSYGHIRQDTNIHHYFFEVKSYEMWSKWIPLVSEQNV